MVDTFEVVYDRVLTAALDRIAALPAFYDRPCAKCDGTTATRKYCITLHRTAEEIETLVDAGVYGRRGEVLPTLVQREHLDWACTVCGFTWQTRCKEG